MHRCHESSTVPVEVNFVGERLLRSCIETDNLPGLMKKHNYNRPLPPNPYNPLSWISPEAVIGENCWIGAFVYIGPGVEIGDNVSIANGVLIYDHDTSWYRASEGRLPAKHYKVTVGRCTQVGSNTVIVPSDKDITIGDHCIVGALSLVKKNIPAYSVAVGIPARVIRHIDEDVIKERIRVACP